MHNKFIIKKWVNRRHCFFDKKNFQKIGVTGDLLSTYLY